MPQGSVIVKVYTSDAYLPLQNVPIIFSTNGHGDKSTPLAIRITDSSGITAPAYFDTPDISQSLTPSSYSKPYTLIDITAAYPGFNKVRAENVQVFPDVQTIQHFQLYPLSSSDPNTSIIYRESAQNL